MCDELIDFHCIGLNKMPFIKSFIKAVVFSFPPIDYLVYGKVKIALERVVAVVALY